MESLGLRLCLELAFAANRQDIVFDNDINVLRAEARQVRLQNEVGFRFVNISFWGPAIRRICIAVPVLCSLIEEAVHLALKNGHLRQNIPSDQVHFGFSPFLK